jgi:long-chain acyl-CoA synthetase
MTKSDTFEFTLPGRLFWLAQESPYRVALREKEFGVWREYTWSDYLGRVASSAAALMTLGLKPGQHVAILSENRTEWLCADLGAQALRCRSVGIYSTNPAPDVAYILKHSQSKVVFCEDQEQVDKVVEAREETPSVEQIVVFDPRGLGQIKDERIMTWQDFLLRGDAYIDMEPGWFGCLVAELNCDEPAMVVYTSGTTGQPKGAILSGRNVMSCAYDVCEMLQVGPRDTLLSYLPLCHVAEKIFTYFLPLASGATVHFGESIDTVRQDVVEVSPSIFLGVPRIWEKMHANVTLKMKDSTWLKRFLFNWASKVGLRISEKRRHGNETLLDRCRWFVADKLIFRPLQERLGMRRCRLPFSGAAPISSELLTWFHGKGIPVYEAYGATECSGIISMNGPDAVRLGSVGQCVPGTKVRIDEDGEIMIFGPHLFSGYLHNDEASTATFNADGWLHSGDLGRIDEDGFIFITGRKKEIIITAGGKNLSPERIENALKMSPYIKEAIAIGDRRKFVSALIQIDFDATGDWGTRRALSYTSFEDLSAKDEVHKLIDQEVQTANQHLGPVEQVKSFRLLPKQLHQDDGEMTATQKVRRQPVTHKFENLIEGMYGRVDG